MAWGWSPISKYHGTDGAARMGRDIAARLDPGAAQFRQAAPDIGRMRRIGIGAGGVVDAHRRLVRSRM